MVRNYLIMGRHQCLLLVCCGLMCWSIFDVYQGGNVAFRKTGYLHINVNTVKFLQRVNVAISPQAKITHAEALVNQSMQITSNNSISSKPVTVDDIIDNLKSPVVVTTTNSGYLDFLLNLLCSISRLQLQYNILIICEDEAVYDVLVHLYSTPHIYIVMTNLQYSGDAFAERFTSEYKRLIEKRTTYIQYLIHKGFDVLFTDNDIVLLDDPFKYFHGDFDLYAQTDYKEGSTPTVYCAGFYFMRATNSSAIFLSNWRQNLKNDKNGDQHAFGLSVKVSNIKIKALPSQQFSSGHVFFSSNIPWFKRKPRLVEMHATFRVGYANKLAALKSANLWFMNGTTCISPKY